MRELIWVEHRQELRQFRLLDVLRELRVVLRRLRVPQVLLRHRDDDFVEQGIAEARHLHERSRVTRRAVALVHRAGLALGRWLMEAG